MNCPRCGRSMMPRRGGGWFCPIYMSDRKDCGAEYDADMNFVPREGRHKLSPSFFSKKRTVHMWNVPGENPEERIQLLCRPMIMKELHSGGPRVEVQVRGQTVTVLLFELQRALRQIEDFYKPKEEGHES